MVLFLFGPLFKDPAIKDPERHGKTWLVAFGGLTILTAIALYTQLGRPELTPAQAQESLKAQYNYSQGRLSQSVEGYETLLELYPDNADLKLEFDNMLSDVRQIPPQQLAMIQTVGDLKHQLSQETVSKASDWQRLGNMQMELGDFEGGLSSFKTMASLEPNNAELQDILARAENFVTTREQAANMAPEDRQAMIENMVAGLAARIYENGGSEEEWTRLIRSRQQLGQSENLERDISQIRKQFEGQPDVIERLLSLRP